MWHNLDHDDFSKSKKALLVSSALALAAFRISIKDSEIVFSGIKLVISTDLLRHTSMFFFTYFSIVFAWLYANKFSRDSIELELKIHEHEKAHNNDDSSLPEKKYAQGMIGNIYNRHNITRIVDAFLPAAFILATIITAIKEKYFNYFS